MHLAEGLLPLSHAAAWTALAAPFVIEAAWSTRKGAGEQRSLTGMSGALLFAVTLLPVPVPLVGITSHLCASPVLALLLGRRRVVLPVLICLLLQALFFAHGGLTTLGANVLTLGVVGPLVALGFLQVLTWLRVPAAGVLFLSCALAHLSVYLVDAGMLGLALAGEKPFLHWFTTVVLGLTPVQVPLALLEGALSVAIVRALARRRPDLVPTGVPIPTRLTPVAPLVLVAWCGLAPLPARAEERWQGADEAVLEAVAERAGRPAQGPVVELSGELTLFTFSAGTFLAGLWVGNTWARLTSQREQKHGR